jgi:hypothetical protein
VVKVIAMGFVINKKSYLRDPWNNLDFFIVCVSIVGMLPGVNAESLKALRTFRILRPLRSINAMPTMRDLIQSLLASIPGLMNVIAFLAFIFSIFAIFGVNQFLGKHNQFCRTTPQPVYSDGFPMSPPLMSEDGFDRSEFVFWEKDDRAEWLCIDDASCER